MGFILHALIAGALALITAVAPQGAAAQMAFPAKPNPLSRAFGASWRDTTTATQVYTVHDLYPFLADEIIRRGLPKAG